MQVVVMSLQQVVEVIGGVVGVEVAGTHAGDDVNMAMTAEQAEQVEEVVGMQKAARPCRSSSARPCRSNSRSRGTAFGK